MTDLRLPPRKPSSLTTIAATLEVVTPIYGGSPVPREIDAIDVIRPASVRGHLRFWWRALHAHTFAGPKELFARESEIWGAATDDTGGRSKVELRIRVDPSHVGEPDDSPIDLRSIEGYALFPAREVKEKGRIKTKTAERRHEGTKFELLLRVDSTAADQVRRAYMAWILFGGYGGRTRRGLGSLTIIASQDLRLPRDQSEATIEATLDMKLFGTSVNAIDVPLLHGSEIKTHTPSKLATKAWLDALGWLREFRQGTTAPDNLRARQPGANGRPSRSNWPEPDKVRHFRRGRYEWAHKPRHEKDPAWPRAGFGLPIIGKFQEFSREKIPGEPKRTKRWEDLRPPSCEPDGFDIVWFDGDEPRNRLGSPLIVKPLPLSGRSFAAMALWLNRSHPPGLVGLRDGTPRERAPFDRLLGSGDRPYFSALAEKATLKRAFFDWLDEYLDFDKTQQRKKGRR